VRAEQSRGELRSAAAAVGRRSVASSRPVSRRERQHFDPSRLHVVRRGGQPGRSSRGTTDPLAACLPDTPWPVYTRGGAATTGDRPASACYPECSPSHRGRETSLDSPAVTAPDRDRGADLEIRNALRFWAKPIKANDLTAHRSTLNPWSIKSPFAARR